MYYSDRPEKWAIIKITHKGDSIYKLLCGWYGGYCGADEWKMSSQIEAVITDGDDVYFHNQSGSVYKCNPKCEGFTGYTQQKYQYFRGIMSEETQIETITWKDYENL